MISSQYVQNCVLIQFMLHNAFPGQNPNQKNFCQTWSQKYVIYNIWTKNTKQIEQNTSIIKLNIFNLQKAIIPWTLSKVAHLYIT